MHTNNKIHEQTDLRTRVVVVPICWIRALVQFSTNLKMGAKHKMNDNTKIII